MKPTRKPSPKLFTSKPTASICGVVPGVRKTAITTTVQALSTATSQALANATSPQSQALAWLLDQDGMKLCPGDLRISQRFTMATFYFSTNGDSSWKSCGRNPTVAKCNMTLTFIPGDPVVARYGNATWLSAVDECKWGGLACNDQTGKIDRIEFSTCLVYLCAFIICQFLPDRLLFSC
jgi:hypothetical protein